MVELGSVDGEPMAAMSEKRTFAQIMQTQTHSHASSNYCEIMYISAASRPSLIKSLGVSSCGMPSSISAAFA